MDMANLFLRGIARNAGYRMATRRYTGEWTNETRAIIEQAFRDCGVPDEDDPTFNEWICDRFTLSNGRENYHFTRATWEFWGINGATANEVADNLRSIIAGKPMPSPRGDTRAERTPCAQKCSASASPTRKPPTWSASPAAMVNP